MKQLIFKVPGKPMAKQRPKFSSKTNRAYTPEPTVNYENLVRTIYLGLSKKEFWDNEPIQMCIVATFKIPESFSKSKARQCEVGQIAPSTKDVDNIAKIVCDALNGFAYSDDRHICQLEVIKNYTANSEEEGTYIYIRDYSLSPVPKQIISLLKELEK